MSIQQWGTTQDTKGIQLDLITCGVHLEKGAYTGLGILKKVFFHSSDLLTFGSGSYSLYILHVVQLHNYLRTVVFVSFGKDKSLSHHHIRGRQVHIISMVAFKGLRMTRDNWPANKSGYSLSPAEIGL